MGWRQNGQWFGIETDPDGEDCNMQDHKRKAPCEGGDTISKALRARPIREKLLLVLCYRFYVFLDVVRYSHRIALLRQILLRGIDHAE